TRRSRRRDRPFVAPFEPAGVGRDDVCRPSRRVLGRATGWCPGAGDGVKILWVKTDFLHPTTRGGQIRTLEMVRQLHKNHEVHYIAFDDPASPEGLRRSSEYCSYAYPVAHKVVPKTSPAFALHLAQG